MDHARKFSLAVGLVALAIGAILAHSLRSAAAFQDDYVFLALARHLDNPLLLLTQDSVGSYFFRPVVMFVWWVGDAAFASSMAMHYALNMAVHAANGLLLCALLRRVGISALVAALAGLAFIAHPAASATGMWLAARFDVFAACFGLLGLIAIERYLERPSWAVLLAATGAMLLAILSKETGFAAAGLGFLAALALERPRHHAGLGRRLLLAAAMVVIVLAALALRSSVLRPVPAVDGLLKILLGMLLSGSWNWLLSLPAFIVVPEGRIVTPLLLGAVLAVAVLAGLGAARRGFSWPLARLALLGIALMGLTAAAQAPTTSSAVLHAFRLDRFEPAGVVTARFYYLPLLGLAMVAAALAESMVRAGFKAVSKGLCVLAVLAIIGMTVTSRGIAREWGRVTRDRSEVYARPMVEAVAALRDLRPGCKIYLLDSPPGADLVRDMVDTGVKRGLPRGHPAVACFIQAEHTPWYHLLEARGLPGGIERPFEIIIAGGKPYAPLVVGNLTYYYVRVGPGADIAGDPRATFLALRGDRYQDVTAQVRSGALKPRFFDRRAP